MKDTSQEKQNPDFYPRYCFPLAPTANVWCFLRTCELYTLEQKDGFQGEGFFFYGNLPIKWVRIVGVVVAIDDFSGLRAYTVDDSSGACIEVITSLSMAKATCTPTTAVPAVPADALAQQAMPYNDIDVGTVVDVKGALATFRDSRQVKLERMSALRGTADEVELWAKRAAFQRDVLDKPWVLQDKTIRKCRREAERSEAEAQQKSNRTRLATLNNRATASSTKNKMTHHQNKDGQNRRSLIIETDEFAQIVANAQGKYNALGL